MGSRKKTVIGLAALVALAALIATLAQSGSAPWRDWLQGQKGGKTLVLSGNIEAHESVLGFKAVQSRIVELPFNEGQWVTRGTLVARADDSDYAQQVAVAEAALNVQRSQLESSRENREAALRTVTAGEAERTLRQADLRRNSELRQKGFVSAAVLDQAEAAYKQADASLARDRALAAAAERNVQVAQASLRNAEESARLTRIVRGYTTLTAPFDGVVTTRQAELGEIVVPGTPVITIADLDHVWLRAYLNETDLSKARHRYPHRRPTTHRFCCSFPFGNSRQHLPRRVGPCWTVRHRNPQICP